MLAAACSGEGGASVVTGGDRAEPTVNEAFVSPVSEALGIAQDDMLEAFDAYAIETEELTRQCMADRGFDYRPDPQTGGTLFQSEREFQALRGSLTQEQFTEQYGFGIATLFELNFKGEGVIDFLNRQYGPAPRSAITEGEQAAYEMALSGTQTLTMSPAEAQTALFGPAGAAGPRPGSCRAYSQENVRHPRAVFDGLSSILGDEVDALEDRFNSDPRIQVQATEWRRCVAEQGLSFSRRSGMTDEIFRRALALGSRFVSSPAVEDAIGQLMDANFVAMTADDRVVLLEEVGAMQGFSWVPAVQEDYDRLIEFELRIAAASAECDDVELRREVRLELETAFVEEHAGQLALIAAGAVDE